MEGGHLESGEGGIHPTPFFCPSERGADVTFGYGGHSEAILEKLQPGGLLLALDVDAKQLPRSEQRLRKLRYGEQQLIVRRSNYAGLAEIAWVNGVDFLLADLGLSSMQLNNPVRGFSYKNDGPLDMRMNPERGQPAPDWLAKCKLETLSKVLIEGADEPRAELIAEAIVGWGKPIETTRQL